MYYSTAISMYSIIYGTTPPQKKNPKGIQLKKSEYLQRILNMLNLEKPKNNSTSEATRHRNHISMCTSVIFPITTDIYL